ncbi:MAG: hypothetical protein EOS66_04100 [Mesorhizobium sp.]|uniref:hypothetical protein n=1 Tax=unclassified Mesorhizobium TaxID=325217 RepID=UPI000FCBCE9A|nr:MULTISPECIES: hypothetical protein [unclassified Mesorhizobium]RWF59941.1 MAG: hypothetical protein EOS66_04100 [Mesorhizobium sp.]RVC97439.1 hypothetical protein EN739_04485 [Mesorhizobium sp. M2A.F.Ca.ET.017.03.2.1]RVD10596.1 hypothetical protein EN753_05690 [Mesorhizobium sp. M2A.F.Ca.ET.029.05.1.1]TIW58899.1 MAG: hypothetical protein E5V54_01120 [Mesorhizobium sp.]TIW82434.1 MAG: hypothetical protein E5V53_08305 [Mesorhizobium sp.]
MTAEVCVMNRLAVVLAADSATTVTYWGENGQEERYFKGANKIFQLSNSHPVGIMIFDSADLLKVPWEVVIKDFRRHLGDRSFNDVPGYAAEFFAYIDGNKNMFPDAAQHEAFLEVVRSGLFDLLVAPTRAVNGSPAEKKAAMDKYIAAEGARIADLNVPDCIANNALPQAIEACRVEMVQWANELAHAFELTAPDDTAAVVEIAISRIFKEPSQHMSTGGLVFAGFGDHDIFPSMAHFTSCGLLAGRHVHLPGEAMKIDHETPAWLAPFAQRNMADTFSAGVSFDIYSSTLQSVTEGLAPFVQRLGEAANFDPAAIENLGELIAQARGEIGDAILAKARKEHALPMRRILGALPVDELAELAETLINLQSLKEKVTKPSASVGGPVDVAAITRSEGLVWIKRKHYFDSAINSRYMARIKAI